MLARGVRGVYSTKGMRERKRVCYRERKREEGMCVTEAEKDTVLRFALCACVLRFALRFALVFCVLHFALRFAFCFVKIMSLKQK